MKTNIEYIRRYDLLPRGSHVLCALSGGRDSVYLLVRLLEWAKEWELTISAAHYNHHLRGEESDRDEEFVRQLCDRLQVPLYVSGGDVHGYAKENGLGVEEAARTLRYAFLEQTLAACGGDVIATAHHADDLAETMLFQLARGAGTKGLSGIPPRRGNIVRPILMVTRQEIDAYLETNGIAYVEDSSNALDDASRNMIRHHVIPTLRQINPEFVRHAARSALLLREDDDYIQFEADRFLEEHPPQQGIDGQALLSLPQPVSARVIRSVWGSGLSYEHVRQILELCGKDGLSFAHIPGAVVRYDCGRLWTDEPTEIPREVRLCGDRGEARYGEYLIRWKMGICTEEIHNSLNTFSLKYENMKDTVTVTARRDGDRIKLAGAAHTKKLKQLFLDHKLTQPQRAAVPVFRDELGVAAVYGFGIAQRCVPEIGDKIITIQCDK